MFNKPLCYTAANSALKTLLLGAAVSTASTVWAQDYIASPMVNIPAGNFMMGSDRDGSKNSPMHSVTLPAFQMGKYPITVAEFRKFASDTGFNPKPTCLDYIDERWLSSPDDLGTASWDKHRYQNNEYQPVTCVSWQDVNAYAKWLSNKTGTQYRLPTEQEWEYATKANTTSLHFWGDNPNEACLYGNVADRSGEYIASKQYGASYVGFIGHSDCDDGEAYNTVVGLYRPNPFGLYDLVGNISQLLSSCYYEGYSNQQSRSAEQMNPHQCEYLAHRGGSWHFPPQPHTNRGRTKRESLSDSALMGFRLAADGHNEKTDVSVAPFEVALKKAQTNHLAMRATIPLEPKNTQLVKLKNNRFELRWQPNDDSAVTGYEIYQSNTPYAHLLGKFFKRYYDKIQTVAASQHAIVVTLPNAGGSFRVVTVTEQLTSLPSQAAAFIQPKTLSIPGRLRLQDSALLDNVNLSYRKAKEDKPEAYYLAKVNLDPDQLMVKATFNVKVNKSAWYRLNYKASSHVTGEFFKLWQGNTLVGDIGYDPQIDDKISTRHKVFLEQGEYQLQLNVLRKGFDYWFMHWLEFSEAKLEAESKSKSNVERPHD